MHKIGEDANRFNVAPIGRRAPTSRLNGVSRLVNSADQGAQPAAQEAPGKAHYLVATAPCHADPQRGPRIGAAPREAPGAILVARVGRRGATSAGASNRSGPVGIPMLILVVPPYWDWDIVENTGRRLAATFQSIYKLIPELHEPIALSRYGSPDMAIGGANMRRRL